MLSVKIDKWVVVLGLLLCFVFTQSCKKDDHIDTSDEGTNEWIYNTMTSYYLWYGDIPNKNTLDFSKSPEDFFASLLSSQDGVQYQNSWLTFSKIEKKTATTKSIDISDSYGFDFAPYKNGSVYFAWVIYVLPNSPAAEAGLQRGDWIVAAGSDTPNVTTTSTFAKGGATTFLLAKYANNQFYKDKTISISASREVEDTPFLADSVYSIGGKSIGYLLYNTFASGPDNKNEIYDTQLKQIFSKFKAKNVNEFILDLRYNQGGLVTSARLMTSYLVPETDLGKTFCFMEYNDKHTSDNKELALLKNADLQNGNLNLKRIYILTGNTTASASEAVINCLIPYIGRNNITLIGEKTIGKRVGSNTFGESEKYDWLLHPITLRIYNASHSADYANGFSPDISLKEVVIGNELYPFGDTRDLLLDKAVSLITGQVSKSENAYYNGKSDLVYPSIGHKIKGLIYDSMN